MQQTMKTASSDEELAFKQKERVPKLQNLLGAGYQTGSTTLVHILWNIMDLG